MGEKELQKFNMHNLQFKEIQDKLIGIDRSFPKYTTQLINIANQNAQGTRPNVVGQLSDLIHNAPEKTFTSWKNWYLENFPHNLDDATNKVWDMISKMKSAMELIQKDMVREWVEDLVIDKTAVGLIIQEIILKFISGIRKQDWEPASAEDESKNIDGYIGKKPVSIKPVSYLSKKSSVREAINIEIIYYKKTEKFLKIYTEQKNGLLNW